MDDDGSLPRLALVDAALRIRHSTPGFGEIHAASRFAPDELPELELVLGGEAETGQVTIGDQPFTVEAVTTRAGARHALLTGTFSPAAGVDRRKAATGDPLSALRPWLETGRALSWVKDLEGRYTYVNPRFVEELATSPERLIGRTDGELEPGETVDGPRRAEGQESRDEPRQLEYTVPAYGKRKPLAVLRFVLRDSEGHAVAVCGVAAPLNKAQLAREEAGRLMALERWRRMDAAAVRAELLEEWGIADAAGGGEGWELDPELFQAMPRESLVLSASHRAPPRDTELERRWSQCIDRLQAEARRWLEKLDDAGAALAQAREETEQARAELERAQREREELERTLSAERAHHEELVRALGQVRARIAELDGTVDQVLATDS